MLIYAKLALALGLVVATADPAANLQTAIDAAIRAGKTEVVVTPGNYYFGNRTFDITDGVNLTVTSAAATVVTTLWFWGANGGVVLRRCKNVTFRGFSIDRSPPPFVQAKVIEASNSSSVLFEVPADNLHDLSPWYSTGRAGEYYPLSFHYGTELADDDGLPLLLSGDRNCGLDLADAEWVGPNQFRYNAKAKGGGCDWAVGEHALNIVWQGFTFVVANSTCCVIEDLTVLASGYIAVAELDGEGGHVYSNVTVRPSQGRLIASTADGFHSTDVDFGPQLRGCTFTRLLDDYMNVQNSLLLVMEVNGTNITVVHPHTNDQRVDGYMDLWYGTSEPLQRLRPGDNLRFFEPVTFRHLDDVEVLGTPVQHDAPADSVLGQKADALFDVLNAMPYHFPAFQPEGYSLQHFRSSVYTVRLARPPPPLPTACTGLPVPYVVESGRTRCQGALVRDSLFSHSTGFFGRWKSSDSMLANNTFAHTDHLHLEVQMIPSFYEGPVLVDNFTVSGNRFVVPSTCTTTNAADFLWHANASDIVVEGNEVVVGSWGEPSGRA